MGLQDVFHRRFSLRGMLLNPKALIGVKFQFNPMTIENTKGVTYSIQEIPGWEAPDIVWVSNGVKKIKFDLMFDRTQGAVDSHFAAIGIPGVGTEPVKAAIESFLYPARPILSFVGAPRVFTAPPTGTLVLGTRFFTVKMEGDQEMRDLLMDQLLTPVRLFAAMKFLVVEEGTINDVNVALRQTFALLNTGLAAADTITETIDMTGGFNNNGA